MATTINLGADNPALRPTPPPGSIHDMRISELNQLRSDPKPFSSKKHRVHLSCPERLPLLAQISEERNVPLVGVIDDAIGRWIDAHHEPWPWMPRPTRKAASGKGIGIRWYPFKLEHHHAITRAARGYHGGKQELIMKAIDAHLMRNDMFDENVDGFRFPRGYVVGKSR